MGASKATSVDVESVGGNLRLANQMIFQTVPLFHCHYKTHIYVFKSSARYCYSINDVKFTVKNLPCYSVSFYFVVTFGLVKLWLALSRKLK